MPAGKRPQSNAMLYTVITFVGLFIVATVAAIIYYVKFEEQRDMAASAQSQLEEVASVREQAAFGKLVGEKTSRDSWVGTLINDVDGLSTLIIGQLPEDTSAQIKLETAQRKTNEFLTELKADYPEFQAEDPNLTGMVRILEKLKGVLDNTTNARNETSRQLAELQQRFTDALEESLEKEKTLLAEKDKYQQQVADIEKDYNELKELLEKTTEQQVQTLASQLTEEKEESRLQREELLKTEAELKMAQQKMGVALDKVRSIEPLPDTEVTAFKADAKVILIDDQTNIVHLNIGLDEGVYQGLTFSIYEKNMPIPRDGKGKAEIEVFNVGKNVCSARIVYSEKKNPVAVEDTAANLIWDADKTNVFVIAGDFDITGNGSADYYAADKLKILIERWGGIVGENAAVDTDFVLLGNAPRVRKQPTFEEMELDPLAMDKYEASVEASKRYAEIKQKTAYVSIPVFNLDRFLHFIGYNAMATKPGAF